MNEKWPRKANVFLTPFRVERIQIWGVDVRKSIQAVKSLSVDTLEASKIQSNRKGSRMEFKQ